MSQLRHCLIVAVFAGLACARAQAFDTDWQVSPFLTSNDLPFQDVRDILLHEDGSLWIATWGGGVTRVQDSEWQQFDETSGLPSNWTYSLAVDDSGAIWVGTADGLARIDRRKVEAFTTANVDEFPNNSIRSVVTVPGGRIWLAFDDSTSVLVCTPKAEPEWSVLSEPDLPAGSKKRLFVDRDGAVWVACSTSHLHRFRNDQWHQEQGSLQIASQMADGTICGVDHKFVRYLAGDQWISEPIPDDSFGTSIAQGPGGRMLVGTRSSLYLWQPGQWRKIDLGGATYCRATVYVPDRNLFFLGTRFGLQRATRPTWMRFTSTTEQIALIPETLCFGEQGNPVCGHALHGLATYASGSWRELLRVSDPDFQPRDLVMDEDSACALCPQHLIRISLTDGSVLQKTALLQADGEARQPEGIFVTSTGELWYFSPQGLFACRNEGLVRLDAHRQSNYTAPLALAEHADGSFYICYRDDPNGIATVERFDGKQFQSIVDPHRAMHDRDFHCVFCSKDGRVWLGTHDAGIFVYDGNSFEHITVDDGLYSNLISGIFEAEDGTIWIHYRECGVGSFRDGLWLHHGPESGLPRWRINRLGEDRHHRLWVSKLAPDWDQESVHGVYLYNPETEPPETEIVAAPEGRVAAHGVGVISFTGRDAWGQTPSEQLMYSWRAIPEGVDPQTVPWSPYSANTSILTDNPPLPGGRHRIEVRALDAARNADPTPATATLEVAYPLWQRPEITVPACLITLLAVVAVLFSIRNYRAALNEARERIRYHEQSESLRRQLVEAQKLEVAGTLAAGLAHDINNSLSAIVCFTDAARLRHPEDTELVAMLDGVDQASHQASSITRSLLTFCHQTETEKRPIDLRTVVNEAEQIIRQILGRNVHVVVNSENEVPLYVRVNAVQIQQVMLNIALNARDAMPTGGRFSIHIRRCDDDPQFTELVLEDTGSGMTDAIRQRIFEPFFTTKPRGQGTGLGMAIVHGIVEDHNGLISVDSSGAGTVFSIRLPVSEPPGSIPSDTVPAPLSQDQHRVLIVEDYEPFRHSLAAALRQEGFEVFEAGDGRTGLTHFYENPNLSFLVIDLDLPKLNGLSCIRRIRAENPEIPIIAISGSDGLFSEDPDLQSCCLLAKPFTARRLIEVMQETSRSAGQSAA